MKFQKQNTPEQDFLNNGLGAPCCPLLRIPKIDEHGMVMEMRCGFEVGSTIAVGFHLQDGGFPGAIGKNMQNQGALSKSGQPGSIASRFISLEVIVVESKIGSGSAGQPVYLVTVMFSQISRKARGELLRYAGRHRLHPKPPHSTSGASSSAVEDCNEKFLREVTRRICLN